jgi:hypothetical protein
VGALLAMLKRDFRYINFYFLFESRLFDIYVFFVCNPGTFFLVSFLGGEHGRKKGEELKFDREAQDDGRQKRQVEEIGVGG